MNSPTSPDTSPGEILVVDDSASALKLLSLLLEQAGYIVRQANSGKTALWSLEQSLPDLILLDISMPEMDGFEVCRRLKAEPATAEVPVMFLSALVDKADIVKGLALGAVDYLGKPYVEEEVLARVQTHVAMARMARALQRERESLEVRVQVRTAQLQEVLDALRAEIGVRQAAEAELRLSSTFFDESFDAILIMDRGRIIRKANPAFERMSGYAAIEMPGQTLHLLESNKCEAALLDEIWNKAAADGHWTGEIWLRHQDGNVFPSLCTLTAVRDAHGELTHMVALLLSVAERRDAETLVNFLSRHDALTGLPNRSTASAMFEKHLAGVEEGEDEIVVLCLGLDRFKQINDLMGYAAGDRVLQLVAGIISEHLHSGDVAYRQSADEFIILRTDNNALRRTRELVYKLIEALQTEFDIDEGRASISASIGIASGNRREAVLRDMIRNADTALSWVKKEGSNGFAFFARDMDSAVRKNYEIEMGLRQALARSDFELYYQPQVDLSSGEVIGAEALLRWKDPVKGFISPAVFIPVAEETGQILAIGDWVLRNVCQQVSAWRDAGLACPRIAVNCSARQFQQEGFFEAVWETVCAFGLPGSAIEIEVTEGAMVQDIEQTIEALQFFKERNIRVAIDDFGTGYSSLSYLKTLPVDMLKIDQSFVRDMQSDPAAKAIVLSIITLAHNLGLKVIAEGVETREELDFLCQHQCNEMQGFYFSKPLPADQFRTLLAAGTRLSLTQAAA